MRSRLRGRRSGAVRRLLPRRDGSLHRLRGVAEALDGGHHHHHLATVHRRQLLDPYPFGQFAADALEHLRAEFLMRQLASAETEGDLYLVAGSRET